VNVIWRIQIGVAALLAGMTLAVAAQAGSKTPAQRALELRGQAMNDKYSLDARDALRIRSDALNRRYHLGVYATSTSTSNAAALRALEIRARAMNARFQTGSYAVVRQSSDGFDWLDRTVAAAGALGLVLIAGGVAVGARRLRGGRLTPV
jgi:hypothetical protein